MLKDYLFNHSNATAIHATHAISEDRNTDQIARVQVATPHRTDINISNEIISNWWLMHFVDREPVEVAIWPPCNKAGAFESYPNSIAAEPLPSPITVEATPYD